MQHCVYHRVAAEIVDTALIALRKAHVETPIALLQRPEPDEEPYTPSSNRQCRWMFPRAA